MKEVRYERDVYEFQQKAEGIRRSGADSPPRSGKMTTSGAETAPAPSVTDERLLRQREQKTSSSVSGVFEGTAGTGGDSRSVSGYTEGTPEGQPLSAYEFFRGKSFKSINFEDGFAVNRYLGSDTRRTGYTSGITLVDTPQLTRATTMKQLEVLSKSRKQHDLETPVERVNRLQLEVTEMINFIEAFMECRKIDVQQDELPVQAASGETPTDSDRQMQMRDHAVEEGRRFFGAHPSTLLKELNVLRHCMDGIVSSDSYQALTSLTSAEAKPLAMVDLAPHPTKIKQAVAELIMAQLEEAENAVEGPSVTTGEVKEKTSYKGPFTYELFTVPSVKDVIDSSRLLELEKRLAELEGQLGLNRGSHFGLPFHDICSALKEIVSRLALLHPSRLDGLTKRFQTLGLQVDELIHRRERLAAMQPKSVTAGATRDGSGLVAEEQAISNLYDFCESTRPASAALPIIVKRLKALKLLHQEAASLTSRLDALETQQEDLAKLLDTTQTHFESLRNSVQKNITLAKGITESLTKQHSSI